jgi:hypothetical protein
MQKKWPIEGILIVGIILGFIVSTEASAQGATESQELKSVNELLSDCRANIARNPTDGQRFCRQALLQISVDPFEEQYRKEKIEAFTLLGESYLYTGRIGDAEIHCDSTAVLTGANEENPLYRRAKQVQDQIDTYFRPLRIKIKNREIPLLSYIEGIDIEFRFPRRLESFQIKRLQILQDAQARREGEFQFVGIDADGHAYMEVKHFPLITYSGRSVGFALIVDGRRRYRFNFTPDHNEVLEIFWDEESQWRLIERIPDSMVKIELPGKYRFVPSNLPPSVPYMSTNLDGRQHVYIPAETEVEMALLQSEDSKWEQIYHFALYGTTGLAIVVGLFGAR